LPENVSDTCRPTRGRHVRSTSFKSERKQI